MIGQSYQGQLRFPELDRFEFSGSNYSESPDGQKYTLLLLANNDTTVLIFEKMAQAGAGIPTFEILDLKYEVLTTKNKSFCLAGCTCKQKADTLKGTIALMEYGADKSKLVKAWKGNTNTGKIETLPIEQLSCDFGNGMEE